VDAEPANEVELIRLVDGSTGTRIAGSSRLVTVRFSAFTVSLPEWTPVEAVNTLAALGYDGIEWRVADQVDAPSPSFWFGNRCTLRLATLVDDAPAVRKLCDDAGLAVPNLGGYARCDEPNGVATLMRGAHVLGAPNVRVVMPAYDGSIPYLPTRDAAARAFDAIEHLAQRHRVRALIELHMNTIIPSASAAAAFLAGRDPEHVGVIFDPGNMVYEGHEHYRMAVEVLGPYLAHVHLKNARWEVQGTREDGSERWQATFAPLTAGVVDVRLVFAALRSVGYNGWVSFEDFSTAQPLYERTRDNLAFARRALDAIGTQQ
jgi:sugar phosphate isomerase/epimerase